MSPNRRGRPTRDETKRMTTHQITLRTVRTIIAEHQHQRERHRERIQSINHQT